MSPEQAARDMLSRMGVMLNRDDFLTYPWEMSAGDVAELANLIAERDALKADAERYRWLRERLSHQRCGPHVGWGTDTLLPGDDPDTAIDAARKEGEG